MKLGTIVKMSFIISMLITIIVAYLKFTHSEFSETLLIIGIIATLVFIVSAILEVRISTKISSSEKTMWIIAFIFLTYIAGLIYFFIGRRRIAANF